MENKNEKLSVVISPEKSEKSDKNRSFWHINREMLPFKLHFLFFVGGAGAFFPFQSAFGITVLGLTASNIAACYTAIQVAIFVLKPGIGYLADYFNKLKGIIIGLAVLQVTSSLLMIPIPNTGMPGIQIMQKTVLSQNNTFCEICFSLETLQLPTIRRYLDEENFRQVSSCFNNNDTEHLLLNCLSDNTKSTTVEETKFEIKYTICNVSQTERIFSEKNTTLENVHSRGDYSNIFYFKKSQITSICILPEQKLFSKVNYSSDDLKLHCFALSSELDLELQYLFAKSDFTSMHCNESLKTSVQQMDEHTIGIENFKTYQFWAFAVCLLIACTCGSTEFTMSDTACYESCQGNDYGQQRVWGAISWGLMAALGGYLNDYTQSYMACWAIYACFTVLQIWNLSRINLVKPDFSQNILKDMKTVFSSLEFLCFEAGVLMNGMFTGIIWYYLTWFIVSIGGNKLIIGLAHTIQCYFGEVPAMYFSGWLIKKLGHFNLVSLALISHGLRFFLYSYLHNAWWLLPIESLHGFTFGSFYAAMTSYGKLNSKPGTEATTQAILCTTFEAVGCGVGCLITGVCLELYGGHRTFFYASFLCVLATIINVFSTFIIKFRKGSQDVAKLSVKKERY